MPMMSPAKISIGRNIGTLVIVLGVLIGGTWAIVKFTTDSLLYQEATSTAQHWAQSLAVSVSDLEQIAAGEQPSTASMTFFKATQKTGEVFRYEIFNREGYSQLVSDYENIGLVNLSEYSAQAARSASSKLPVVDTLNGISPGQPSFYARAYLPVVADQRVIAIVGAYVDQTEQRDQFYRTFLKAATALCLLTGLSFALPAVAWYRRTKEKQKGDRRIRFLAHHDALTELTNRPHLIDKLERALAALPMRGGSLAVHFIDLDRFKEVNDTLGHDGGDFLLKTVADRLRAVIRSDDVVARLGGDEFVVVQNGIVGGAEAEAFAHRVLNGLMAPVKYKGEEILTTVSIGVAMAPRDGNSPERLLKSADLALYRSKADGRNCVRLFSPEMDSELRARVELERLIRDAVLHDRFQIYYQPIFEMSDRRLVGFEALIRLPAKDGKLIPPLAFIPVAENLRLIDKIGAWVLQEACRMAATWPEHLTVAVNLSSAQFSAGNVTHFVAAALREAGLAAHRLDLEITETLLLDNTEAVMAQLRALKALGVGIVMDDFGTGYSSLSYLWRFPFDKIKIDRSFMQGFDSSGRGAETVVKTIIALGRELHMRVTVEGVETAAQAAFLDNVEGDQAQGFFFGRPVPASEVGASIFAARQLASPSPASEKAEAAKPRLLNSATR
jgi:diguanylate cyclase (GGDEF)-like protein